MISVSLSVYIRTFLNVRKSLGGKTWEKRKPAKKEQNLGESPYRQDCSQKPGGKKKADRERQKYFNGIPEHVIECSNSFDESSSLEKAGAWGSSHSHNAYKSSLF